jgi:hypothetical protein
MTFEGADKLERQKEVSLPHWLARVVNAGGKGARGKQSDVPGAISADQIR